MVSTRTLLSTALGLLAVSAATSAQNAAQPFERSIERVKNVKSYAYDFASKRVIRNEAPDKRFVATFCYVNTDTVGGFTSVSPGYEYIDWGILGGTQTTQCAGLSSIVSNFNFAYATSAQDTSVAGPGAALTVTFYTNWTGFGADSGNCPVATFAFSGMPGFSGSSTGIGSGYFFTVDLSGGFEFSMPDGRFGYGYRSSDPGQTGPILCLTGDAVGGLEPATGNQDVWDIWAPDTKGVNIGSFFFGGPPNNFSSWYGQVARADLSGSPAAQTERFGFSALQGSLSCNAPELGGSWILAANDVTGHALAVAFAFDTVFGPFVLGGGQTLLCIDSGNGELLTGGGLPLTGPAFGPWGANLTVPTNLDLCGFSFVVQTIFFGAVIPFRLSSSCDATLGG